MNQNGTARLEQLDWRSHDEAVRLEKPGWISLIYIVR